jgi:hypothetical protein
LGWVGLALFLIVSTSITWYGQNQRSGWVLMSVPGGDGLTDDFPLLGYCHLHGEDPFFYESWLLVDQVAFFSGWRDARLAPDISRPYPAFFAALLAPAVGTIGGLVLVNWLAWALCAWATWRLSMELFRDDLSALLAVIFVCGGMGIVFHIGEQGTHLLGFAGYYLGVYLLYASRIPFERRPWRAHLTVGAFFALVGLTYGWWGALLIAIYALSGGRYNRWYHVAGAVALALSAPSLWSRTLPLVGGPSLAGGAESHHVVESFMAWWELFKQPPQEIGTVFAQRLWGVGFLDSPVVIVLGVLGCLLLPRNNALRWFGALVLALPLITGFLILSNSDAAETRGYLTYAVSIWIYCWLGRLLALGLRQRARPRIVVGLVLSVAVVTHFAWSTSHFWGWLGPVKTYMFGWENSRAHFWHFRPTVLSMTGRERTPVLFGGGASLGAAGACVTDPQVAIKPRSVDVDRALGSRALLFAYLALFGATVATTARRRLLIVAGMGCLAVLSPGLSLLTFRAVPSRVDAVGLAQVMPVGSPVEMKGAPVTLAPGARLRCHAELSRTFLDALRAEMGPEDRLCFYVGIPSLFHNWGQSEVDKSRVEVSVAAGPNRIPTRSMRSGACLAVDPQAALAALVAARAVTVEVANHLPKEVVFAAWQRQPLPGRRIDLTLATGVKGEPPDRLPAVEVRLVRPDGSIKLAGF